MVPSTILNYKNISTSSITKNTAILENKKWVCIFPRQRLWPWPWGSIKIIAHSPTKVLLRDEFYRLTPCNCILDANLQKLAIGNARHFQYIAYKLIIMKLQEDSRRWTPFSTTPKCVHGSSIKSGVVNPLTTTWANHTNNPGKALPGLIKYNIWRIVFAKYGSDSEHRTPLCDTLTQKKKKKVKIWPWGSTQIISNFFPKASRSQPVRALISFMLTYPIVRRSQPVRPLISPVFRKEAPITRVE